jgi:SAM-dependent methyltransferase
MFDYDAELSRYHARLLAAIDISAPMLERARRLPPGEESPMWRSSVATRRSTPFRPKRFTVGLSCFGTMFFTDPLAAFANIARALHPGARFALLVWQDSSRQEWDVAIRQALTEDLGRPPTLSRTAPSYWPIRRRVNAILTTPAAGRRTRPRHRQRVVRLLCLARERAPRLMPR